MIVCKFGGTSVADGARFAASARLAVPPPGEARLVVVSAMARVTRELLRLGEIAPGTPGEAAEALEALLERHRAAIREAGVAASEIPWLEESLERERQRALEMVDESHREGRTTPRSADRILAVGELLSSRILAATLRSQGYGAVWIDPRVLIATDSRFGSARPDLPEIRRRASQRALPHLERGELVVTGGYIGREPGGATTTLGFEASDYSATLLGAALGAATVEIWTDVDGVATADPKLVPGARIVPALSYEQAADLAYFGASVLHPDTMAPLVPSGAAVVVRNSFRPQAPGTRISAQGAAGRGVRAVTARGPFSPSALAPFLSRDCGARAFRTLNGALLAPFAPTFRLGFPALELPAADLLERLGGFADGCAGELGVVSLVGAELPAVSLVVDRAATALDGLPLLAVAQRECATHLSLLVPAELRLEAVRRLHRALLEMEGPRE